jgi:hypothetical protein
MAEWESGFRYLDDEVVGFLDAVGNGGVLTRGGRMAAVRAWQAAPLPDGTPGGGGLAAWAERSGRRRA